MDTVPASPRHRVLRRVHPVRPVRSTLGSTLPTFGVEEEFGLLDPQTGQAVTLAREVIAACADPRGVVPEVMRYMVEIKTPVSQSVPEAYHALLARRIKVTQAAAGLGAVVVPSGVVPMGQPQPPPVLDDSRYRELAARLPGPMSSAGTLACHVHVAVPTRGVAVQVLRRTRRWLPALIALTGNSPIYDDRDTSWASWRYRLVTRWPTAQPAPPVGSEHAYDQLVASAVATGSALDTRSVYYFIRVSPRYPTVEVRIADVLPTAEEAAAYAALVRAMVAQAMKEEAAGLPIQDIDQGRLICACEAAARHGLTGVSGEPVSWPSSPGWELVDDLLRYVLPSLARDPAAAWVLSTVEQIRQHGNGAHRQRRLWEQATDIADFARSLARWTVTPGLDRARNSNSSGPCDFRPSSPVCAPATTPSCRSMRSSP